MAFAAAFLPTFPSCAPPLGLPCELRTSSPERGAQDGDGGGGAREGGAGVLEAADTRACSPPAPSPRGACQFAPLLVARKEQASASAAAQPSGREPEGSPEERLAWALESLVVLREAGRSARALGRRLVPAEDEECVGMECSDMVFTSSGPEDEDDDDSAPEAAGDVGLAMAPRSSSAPAAALDGVDRGTSGLDAISPTSSSPLNSASATLSPQLYASLGGLPKSTSSVDSADMNLEGQPGKRPRGYKRRKAKMYLVAAYSKLDAKLSRLGQQVPCVEGFLTLGGTFAHEDPRALREKLHAVVLRLVEPLAQVSKIFLDSEPDAGAGAEEGSYGGQTSTSRVFRYRICLVDPNDVEPLKETLLLEAESGGARHLLPLLCEQFCDARHLRVRVSISGFTM